MSLKAVQQQKELQTYCNERRDELQDLVRLVTANVQHLTEGQPSQGAAASFALAGALINTICSVYRSHGDEITPMEAAQEATTWLGTIATFGRLQELQ